MSVDDGCHHLGTSLIIIWEPELIIYIYYITLILLVMKNLLGYIGSLGKKKLSDAPEHHARQVSGERESAGGEP